MKIFTTEIVEELKKNSRKGLPIKRKDKIYHEGIEGVRKKNIPFLFTEYELEEYSKCYNDIIYFINTYCKIKTTDGINNIKLHKFQEDILKQYQDNRFTIFQISSQMGVTLIKALVHLHKMLFHSNENILLIAPKLCSNVELIQRIKDTYVRLPFFLQKGVILYNQSKIIFENESSIKSISKFPDAISRRVSEVDFYDAGSIRNSMFESLYKNLIPTILSGNDSKLCISVSNVNEYIKNLMYNAELPEDSPYHNNFKVFKYYWWEYPNRDEEWKQNQIRTFGKDTFDTNYDLKY